jgi:DNA-binding transcriptional MerR regulator
MGTYTIGEVAERSGFTASALRYYEDIGLVAPATRTDAGYRLYDDGSLARLAFIARAKQLGCTLEEITDLATLWDGATCGPVQRRFHELVTGKIGEAQHRLAELTTFTAQLQEAATQLAGPASDGPCDDGCACLAPPAGGQVDDTAIPVELTAAPPIACTLEAAQLPGRLEAWEAVLAQVSSRERTADGRLRLAFATGLDAAELAGLAAAEQACCSFFSFAVTLDSRGVALEVGAPEAAADVVAAVFGVAP